MYWMCFWFLLFSGHTSLPFSTVKQSRLCIHKYYVLYMARRINQYVFEIIAQDNLVIWYEDVPVLLLKLFSYSPCQSPCLLSSHLVSSALSSYLLLPHLLASSLVSSHLVLSRHISSLTLLCFLSHLLFSLIFHLSPLSYSPLALSPFLLCILGQLSMCVLYLLSHFVKNLLVQSSDWSLGPAGDEAILIPSGILAKLVVFSMRTVSTEWGHSDILTSICSGTYGQKLNAASQPNISQRALRLQRHSECILIVHAKFWQSVITLGYICV